MMVRLMSMAFVAMVTMALFVMVAGAAGVVTLLRLPRQLLQPRA